MSAEDLAKKQCKPCEGGVAPMAFDEADTLLKQLKGWARDGHEISKTYSFKNYYQTMAFVNAAAYVSHLEDHHPDMRVMYNKCTFTYTTHAIEGLSENDFICAAKVESLYAS